MIRYRANWILPIASEPLPNTWVAVERGRVVAIGRPHDGGGSDVVDLGRAVVLPGLVNAHTHFELAYLRDAIPSATQFVDWVRQLMRRRREYPDPADPAIVGSAADAIREARAAGTALVGDISNTLVTVPLLGDGGLPAVVFYELIRFNAPDPVSLVHHARQRLDGLPPYADVRTALAPHAPYSVAPLVFRAMKADLERHPFDRSSVHLGESAEEVRFIRTGDGPWRTLLEELGVWTDAWRAPGVSPVAYLVDAGFLDRRVVVVHGVQFTDGDLMQLASIGATIVSCPRSNRHVGVGSPPLAAFYAARVPVAFGTDSLASVEDLSIFGELAEARRIAPGVPARTLLESATRVGAEALGFGGEFGTIEPGKRADLLAVRLPHGVADVEEYLLTGVTPDAVRWIH
jgi:cytosine/adenosine deaminase-related metal-dependent hydrolase